MVCLTPSAKLYMNEDHSLFGQFSPYNVVLLPGQQPAWSSALSDKKHPRGSAGDLYCLYS